MTKPTKNRITRLFAIVLAAFALFPLTVTVIGCGGRGAESFLPNVVRVTSGASYGSGVIIDSEEDGLICLTNYHAVMNAAELKVTVGSVAASAELLGYSDYHDIAVLKVRAAAPDGLVEVRYAEAVNGGRNYAIGNANNGGIVAAEGECINRGAFVRTERLNASGDKFVPVIATSAKIERGMSGGALLDGKGRLIGIASYGGDSEYYAAPIGIVRAVEKAARNGRTDERGRVNLIGDAAYGAAYDENGFIGIGVSQTSLTPMAEGFVGVFEKGAKEGVRVTKTGAECPLEVGDLVTEIGDLDISSGNKNAVFAELYKYASYGTGKTLTVTTSGGITKEFSGLRLIA